MAWTAYSVLWILMFAKGVWCLSIIQLQVPNSVFEGDTIRLTCRYNLEEDSLYRVKWYKDGNEFFRYTPSNTPQKEYFDVESVRVDMEKSGDKFVTLEDVDLSTSGEYICDVFGESPFFRKVRAQAELTVQEYDGMESSSSRIGYGLLSFAVVLGMFIWWHPMFHLSA